MSHEAKQFYLDQISRKPKSNRFVEQLMMRHFPVSGIQIRTQLLEEGYIVVVEQEAAKDGRIYSKVMATGKKLPKPEMEQAYSATWEDGTPKSHGNAFDWRNYGSAILNDRAFRMAEMAKKNSTGTGVDARKQFTIYSRSRPDARRGASPA
jgi:hypothetical protein